MNKILAATVALSVFATAGIANAQSYSRGQDSRYEQSRDYNGGYDRSNGYDRSDRYEQSRDRSYGRGYDRRDGVQTRNDNRWEQRASRRYSAGRYQAPRGYQVRQWSRGDRMPSAYRGNAYVVDHRRYGLGAPPRGYHYVRSGNDAVLTGITTGIIASVVLSLFQ